MEIAWVVVLILLLIVVVLGWQWASARSTAAAAQARLEQAEKRALEAEARLEAAEKERKAPAARSKGPATDAWDGGEPETGGPVTQLRAAPQTEPEPEPEPDAEPEPAVTQIASQKTALYVAPKQVEDPNRGLPYLVVEDGEDGEEEGETYHLAFDKVSAGRGADNDIVLKDQSASRVHFIVSFTDNRFLLEDNDSTNGTVCNDEKTSRKWLEFGDRIKVGNTVIRFSCKGYDLKDEDADKAVAELEQCVERQSDFVDALKLLAFMLERNVARRKEATAYWQQIARLEKSS